MRVVEWKDDKGYRRAALLRDGDPEDEPERGLPCQPPDLKLINWDAVARDLHNELVDRRLFTWRDVQAAQNGVTAAILSVLKKRIITLYRNVGTGGTYD